MRHRVLHTEEAELWPEIAQQRRAFNDEVQAIYPHRWAVPRATWRHLFQTATREIGILTYSGLFLAEDTGIIRLLADQARSGVRVPVLLGDPDAPAVGARGIDEAIGSTVMVARVRNALTLYRPLIGTDNVEIRLHQTVLYNSIYRSDADLLVNSHAYGTPAAQAPVFHLHATEQEAAAATYLGSFEHVWASAQTYEQRA